MSTPPARPVCPHLQGAGVCSDCLVAQTGSGLAAGTRTAYAVFMRDEALQPSIIATGGRSNTTTTRQPRGSAIAGPQATALTSSGPFTNESWYRAIAPAVQSNGMPVSRSETRSQAAVNGRSTPSRSRLNGVGQSSSRSSQSQRTLRDLQGRGSAQTNGHVEEDDESSEEESSDQSDGQAEAVGDEQSHERRQ